LGDNNLRWTDLNDFFITQLEDDSFKQKLLDKWPGSEKGDPKKSTLFNLTKCFKIKFPSEIDSDLLNWRIFK
jgi:hypothetical protein